MINGLGHRSKMFNLQYCTKCGKLLQNTPWGLDLKAEKNASKEKGKTGTRPEYNSVVLDAPLAMEQRQLIIKQAFILKERKAPSSWNPKHWQTIFCGIWANDNYSINVTLYMYSM